MVRHRWLWLVAGCVPAMLAYAGAGGGVPLVARDHLDAGPRVELRSVGSELRLAADCSGCVDGVRFLEWTGADAGGARVPLAAAIRFDAGARDAATSKLAVAEPRVLAVDVVVDWRDDAGTLRQKTSTFFARVDARGALQPITWAEFAIARGYARAAADADGSVVLQLDVLTGDAGAARELGVLAGDAGVEGVR